MKPITRNILAVIIGLVIGNVLNMSLVNLGLNIYPIEGYDGKDFEFLAKVMPTLPFAYFIFPFLAHALGTLAGAFVAGLIAATHKMKFAMAIGGFFLIGGILVNIMITGPIWFTLVDIFFAYIPMAWFGGKLALTFSKQN